MTQVLLVWAMLSGMAWFIYAMNSLYFMHTKITRLDVVFIIICLPFSIMLFVGGTICYVLYHLILKFKSTELWDWLTKPVIKW